jgi:hypothetical protein
MSSKAKSSVLGGHIYLVEHVRDGKLVHKVGDEGAEKQVYFVDRDGVCECPAGEHGRVCKHVSMVEGTLAGPELSKGKARRMLEAWLDKAREEVPTAKFANLLRFKKAETVGVATAAATKFDVGCAASRFTLWTEVPGLLIRVHVFKDPTHYRAALAAARTRG